MLQNHIEIRSEPNYYLRHMCEKILQLLYAWKSYLSSFEELATLKAASDMPTEAVFAYDWNECRLHVGSRSPE